jgi:hypothetical protein
MLLAASILALGFCLVTPSSVQAQNGCGPGDWRGRFVPSAPFTFPFGAACNTHDRCYGTTFRYDGGYWVHKQRCDERFYMQLTRLCYTNYYSNNSRYVYSWCQYLAYEYYKAVWNHGGGAYRRAQYG